MSAEQVDITQQATAPTTAAPRVKNPKRVAAGKAIAEKTRQAREAQKKALAKAAAIIANDESKKDTPEPGPELAIPDPVNADQPPPQGVFLLGLQHDPMVDGWRHCSRSARALLQT